MPGDRCPTACVQTGCTTLSISIPSASRGHVSVTAVSNGVLKKQPGLSTVHQVVGLVKALAFKTRLVLLKLFSKTKRREK